MNNIENEKIIDISSFNFNNVISLDDILNTYVSNSPRDTEVLGENLASLIKDDDTIVLNGELGSGKTLIILSICKKLNILETVTSPTFSIVNEYTYLKDIETKKVFHFDVYRLENEEDFLNSVGDTYFNEGICLIEWGNILKNILPSNTIYIDFTKDILNEDKRYIHIYKGGK